MNLDECIKKFLSEGTIVEARASLKSSDVDKLQKLAIEFMSLGEALQKQASEFRWGSDPVSSEDLDNLRSLRKAFSTITGGYRSPSTWVRDLEETIKSIESKQMKSGGAPTIRRTAEQLQLYSDQPGAAKAAQGISAALTKATKVLFGFMSKNPDYVESKIGRELGKVYKSDIAKVLEKYGEFGAMDTESHHAAQQILIDQIKTYYGITGWTDLADYL